MELERLEIMYLLQKMAPLYPDLLNKFCYHRYNMCDQGAEEGITIPTFHSRGVIFKKLWILFKYQLDTISMLEMKKRECVIK